MVNAEPMPTVGPLAQLRKHAAGYARVALTNIRQEYPNDPRHLASGADDRATPRELHPAFYGSFDWHSSVEMHWLLVRLLRLAPDAVAEPEVRAALDEHLTAYALAAEAAYLAQHRTFARPYGWGWALRLVAELAGWDDPDGQRWAANAGKFAATIVDLYLEWLPKVGYPVRWGAHQNSAFGLSLALPYARHRAGTGDATLLTAIERAAFGWFGEDVDYPTGWEPSGTDFLSPALVEAELMANFMDAETFAEWLDWFLPELVDGKPPILFTPVTVTDTSDGQLAHLHGLNLTRAWCMRRLAQSLPADDARPALLRASADRHTAASLPAALCGDYPVEHWLPAYAVLLLS
jgi:hypothetical protein